MDLSAWLSPRPVSLTLKCKSSLALVHVSYRLIGSSIFLYFFILAFFAGIFYFFYTVWIAPYFPQKRRGRDSKRAGVATKKTDLDVPSPDAAVPSASSYNSDWIPAHHIQKPEARKVKGTRSKSRA